MYSPNLYEIDAKNRNRYVLGQTGPSMLAVIGVNPSTADDSKPDPTLRKVIGFAHRNKFDGYVMLNLYPQRATFPSDLHKRKNNKNHYNNLTHISSIIEDNEISGILAAWGNTIETRPYLIQCLQDIYEITGQDLNWLQIGDPTKGGHPRHPSRAGYNLGLSSFDIKTYLHKTRK